MRCPECEYDLAWVDYYGKIEHSEHYWIHPRSWIEKVGDIFKCKNENCEYFDEYFYTDNGGSLNEGHPC
jgi:hypothetical protein